MPLGNREDQTTGYQHTQDRRQDTRKSNPALALRSLNRPRFCQDQNPDAGASPTTGSSRKNAFPPELERLTSMIICADRPTGQRQG
jgi:hypothetical protein